ncbi:MAG: molybdopterin-dependent oxidoreductase [Fimbriimonas ginsengisoli]|uniref:Molybdopterin-dependent oxidoreductase n=1 Tax=Fimbriimonas ginsengisoli TaxID=1005039 RepID=A0A931PUE4_FIMGI|nr:molybdopterin-dependent oxidoreductase [Fimbriimonas ginsengisoli]
MSEIHDDPARQMRAISRRSFLWAAAAVVGAWGAIRWIASRRTERGLVWPLRRALDATDAFGQDFYEPARLAPTFDASRINAKPRVNGEEGQPEERAKDFELIVEGMAGDEPRTLRLKDIQALPKVEMITELHCIEGWTQTVRWGGAWFSDFVKAYPPDGAPDYVAMETADGVYFVGLDMGSAMHPQTLLCYEMNGAPLEFEHGAPLRLVIPVKYGIKNIKWLGRIRYADERPKDFWAEEGYDWFAGL